MCFCLYWSSHTLVALHICNLPFYLLSLADVLDALRNPGLVNRIVFFALVRWGHNGRSLLYSNWINDVNKLLPLTLRTLNRFSTATHTATNKITYSPQSKMTKLMWLSVRLTTSQSHRGPCPWLSNSVHSLTSVTRFFNQSCTSADRKQNRGIKL